MECDLPRGLDRFLLSSIHDKLRDGHFGPRESASLVELAELGDVPELAEFPARFGDEAILQLGLGAAELDEAKGSPPGGDVLLERGNELIGDGRFRGEGHDHAGLLGGYAGVNRVEPQLLAQRDEGRRPERKERRHQINHSVVVEKAVTRVGREQLADSELADARAPEEEDDLGSHISLKLGFCDRAGSSHATNLNGRRFAFWFAGSYWRRSDPNQGSLPSRHPQAKARRVLAHPGSDRNRS